MGSIAVPGVGEQLFPATLLGQSSPVLRRILRDVAFKLARGQSFFFAEGWVFKKSRAATEAISRKLAESKAVPVQGWAYKRLGTKICPHQKIDVDAVLINSVGRLGNSIIQVGNAIQLAEKLDSAHVKYFRWDAIHNRAIFLDSVTVSKLEMSRPAGEAKTTVIWRTPALESGAIGFELHEHRAPTWARDLAKKLDLRESNIQRTPLQLTIHLRSGDVFAEVPHPAYGQPPCAFYQRVLEHKPWKKVTIVVEDEENPCLLAIQDWCTSNGVAYSVSGSKLSDSLRALLVSSHIAVGIGTFVPAIQILDDEPRNFYVFSSEPHQLLRCKQNTIHVVEDRAHTYTAAVMQLNWANTNRQRALMQEYPLQFLSLPRPLAEKEVGRET